MSRSDSLNHSLEGVAIVGMSGRFPGARTVAEFWQNQLHGVEAISHLSVEELDVAEVAEKAGMANYVRSRGILKDIDLFDPAFFGILPREAELMDPQHRLFLECCWETFEDAGYDPIAYPGSVGVFAGSSFPSYFLTRLCRNSKFIDNFAEGYQIENFLEMMGSFPDFLATRVAYKLNLRGPSITLQCACSTSLVAICQASQSLLTYQCDMALAGGASIPLPQNRGYFYQEGSMGSIDGHTRTFDADAQGTVFGSGVAAVLLKRYEDAVRDGDQIYAIIRGFALNNDGSARAGYTAPSVDGQSTVIALAQEAAGIDPSTIGYVEAHGTGTPLGDPIELAALADVFRARTDAKQFCVIGTAKTNIGHLDIASGVTGLIHATHIVKNGKFPPTLHFKRPNPKFDLNNSPFRVNTELSDWKTEGAPRRAGVSAFGVGGTNAHVVLEEAPVVSSAQSRRPVELLALSARSAEALDATTQNLAGYLGANSDANLADVAFTLQVGRRAFDHRRILVAHTMQDATTALGSKDLKRVFTRSVRPNNPGVCFLFPGQGSQQPNMGREIYETERVFREEVDRCAKLLQPSIGLDLRTLIYPQGGVNDELRDQVTQTLLAQPAIFTTEYALAKLWISWGIEPRFMIGHSVGEFVAACLAGVFTLADALQLIAARGRMMQSLPHGAMLGVRMSEAEIRPLLRSQISIAAINTPSLCVVAGPIDAMENFEEDLKRRNIPARRLHTSHAFHSSMMDPILEPFTAEVGKIKLSSPTRPYISGVTGDWITDEQSTDPSYWARHFREPVNFSPGIRKLREKDDCILLEVGPGNTLAALARQHGSRSSDQIVVSSLTDGTPHSSESLAVQQALGWLWLGGVQPDWSKFHSEEKRQRVSLPTYPFERKRFWFEPKVESGNSLATVPGNSQAKVPTREIQNSFSSPVPPPSSPIEESTMTQPSVPQSSRRDRLRTMLIDIFQDLSGMNVSDANDSATFLEMGFDSLFLTQITQALQSKFHLKITFRQLLGDLATLDSLVTYVDEKIPAEMFPEQAPTHIQALQTAALAMPSLVPGGISSLPAGAPAATSQIEQLMRDQLQTMNQLFVQLLAALQNASPSPLPAAASLNAPTPVASAPKFQLATGAKETEAVGELKGYTPFKPLQKSVSGELTPQQEGYIRELSARYTRRTQASKSKTQQYRQVLADPRVVTGFRVQWKEMVYPIITDRSKGSHLWDIDGNEYVDLLSGFGPIMLGHRPEYLEKAIEKQLHEGFEIGPQTLLAGEAATLLCEMTGNERATFCNTGSEAVIAAMRVARTVTGRNKVVFFAGDYHGMFDEVLVKGIKKAGEPHTMPIAPGIPRENVSNMVVMEYGSEESLEWIRKNAKDLAAVLVEPVQSRHPNLQPVKFLKELRKITEESDTCLVFDEVVTGFRSHPAGCQALFDIRADLVTYGKVVAGGMPIGILAGKAKFMDALDGGSWQFGDDSYPEVGVTFFAGTFVRHPLAMAACVAVLKYLKQQGPQLQQNLNDRAAALVGRLNALLEKNRVPTHIEHFSSVFYFSFPSDFAFSSLFYFSLREKGIHILENFPCFLGTEHSDADLNRIVRAFEETIAEMQAGGVLGWPSDSDLKPASAGELVAAEPGAGSAPMTEPQREIFLAAKLDEAVSCAFNESFSVHLEGNLQAEVLWKALDTVIARHEALRATVDPDGATLHFQNALKLETPLRDLSVFPAAEREKELKRLLAEDARTPFDMTKGPLIRAELVRLETNHHILLFTSHHMVCDGWSTNVLLDELATLYSAGVQGRSPELSPAMPFSTYAREQAAEKKTAEGARVESYWLNQFKELPPPLDLPLDHSRPVVKGYAGATYRTQIESSDYLKIKQLGSKRGCTLFATLLAGFQTLLYRLSAQNDVVIGIPTAGQSLLENGNLVGHCVNFLPLRARFLEGLTFSSLLGEVKKTLLDAYDNQSYTYGTLVRRLGIPREPSRLPLMEVQFNLERIHSGSDFGGLKAVVDPNAKSAVNFDLFFNVVESNNGLLIDCDYNTGLFEESTVARWLNHFKNLLLGAIANPDSEVDDLPLMRPNEVTSLLHAWNPNLTHFPVRETMKDLFERQAARQAENIALVMGEETMTYRELNERANQLARTLRKKGVKRESLVAVCFERSLEMIVSFLAVVKAGGAYVPVDSSYPKERLVMMLEDAKPSVLLTQDHLVAGLPRHTAEVIAVDKDWPMIDQEAKGNLEPLAGPENSAYMIYTSGSTGKPKGVIVTHANVVRLLKATDHWYQFNERDVWSLFHTYSFDVSVWEIWGSLLTGGRLVVIPFWVTRSPQEFYQLLVKEKVTVLCQTPVAFYQLIQVEEAGTAEPLALRYVILAGEALNFSNLRPWVKRHGDAKPQLLNMYGPTEATIYCTYRRLREAEIETENRSLIGVPVPDMNIYLLDRKLCPVPPGVIGEMYIAGAGVARGYFQRPELTAEKFVPDPFSARPGARMYRSGDVARFLMEGDIDFRGRIDNQVKIHGFRIELGEIESILAQHPDILEVTVMARKDGPGEQKLVAYFAARPGKKLSGTELREFLQAKLPAHMIPFAYVELNALPLNANGKLDHSKLPAPDVQRTVRAREFLAPSTPEEKTLAEILAVVLGVERVGITDNLFELGADSLHVFQITSRAANAGLAINPRLLLQERTIAGVLAEMGKERAKPKSEVPILKPAVRKKYRVPG